ncbi:LuxR C-terminal-related transcriptional regulator [Streptomyces sp. NPDC051576]|uniref:helix-turn-helix transcriptional regulator n=1 Tax=Streptomyces sp. NPDC051576 TaxID=3155803 RepID=UPI003414D4A1
MNNISDPKQLTGSASTSLDDSGAGLAVLDTGFIILNSNQHFRRNLAVEAEETHGRTIRRFLHPDSFSLLTQRLTGQGQAVSGDIGSQIRLIGSDGAARLAACEVIGVRQAHRVDEVFPVALLIRWRLRGTRPASTNIQLSRISARVLELVAEGCSSLRIATELHLTRPGVDYHVTSLMRRFRVPNRSALISKAYHTGIVGPGIWPPRVAAEFIKP